MDIVDGDVNLLWRPQYADTETVTPATLEQNGAEVTATVTMDFQTTFVPAGITIEYRWTTGRYPLTQPGEPHSFDWHDTRWDWATLSSGLVTVRSYGNGAAAGAWCRGCMPRMEAPPSPTSSPRSPLRFAG